VIVLACVLDLEGDQGFRVESIDTYGLMIRASVKAHLVYPRGERARLEEVCDATVAVGDP
jgi:hypothetical protein